MGYAGSQVGYADSQTGFADSQTGFADSQTGFADSQADKCPHYKSHFPVATFSMLKDAGKMAADPGYVTGGSNMVRGPGVLLLPLLAGLGAAVSGLPENLRVEGINTIYLLKWDWDYQKNPNVTFSVTKAYSLGSTWSIPEGCENITASECNVSGIDVLYRYKFLVSVYNSKTDEHNSSIATFSPLEDTSSPLDTDCLRNADVFWSYGGPFTCMRHEVTEGHSTAGEEEEIAVIGPPTNLTLTLQNNDLHITVMHPEAFHNSVLRQNCPWMYHLESWKTSTPTEVNAMQNIGMHFKIDAVEASTTYCARAYTKCSGGNRTGLYSKIYCITTAPRSYIKEWIIGSVFVAIIVISAILYICLCPLKRYLRHIFFPKSKLPSSIEKGLQDSPRNYIKNLFLLHEEEKTDRCYIMQNSPVDAETTMDKNSSEAKGRDSGNYSNEDDVTAATQ
ncbi:PREDICTED: interferon alpha/beta receptor 1-like [Nanorana parkeri]|uniref:interferon alpha/beta receptor 1-like n=1 Tax=Nanorana parkeri TaxID=125878 RepID=UPI0008543BDC|nr:PREDICTED: interferon alpha/beta receptor 1-like [Nanorana parkeri]